MVAWKAKQTHNIFCGAGEKVGDVDVILFKRAIWKTYYVSTSFLH